jgi:hypothetical protein
MPQIAILLVRPGLLQGAASEERTFPQKNINAY